MFFNILTGYESGFIKSYAFKAGEVIADGNWVVFDKVSGGLVKQTGALTVAQGLAFPVFGGNSVRFDSKELGVVSCITSKSFVGETDAVQAVTINVGDALTLLDGLLTKADTTGATTAVSPLVVVGYATKPSINGVVEFARA